MLRRILTVGLVLWAGSPVHAQFFPQPAYYPVPVYYPQPSGVGIYYQTGRLRVAGFFGAPLFTPYTSINNNVTFSFSGPSTYVVSPRLLAALEEESYDISGIDLDQKPLARKRPIGNGDPEQLVRVEPLAPAKPAEVAPNKAPRPEMPPLPPELPPPAGNALDESARLNDLGRAAFRARLYGLAAMRFRQAVKTQPTDPHSYFLLAQGNFALGRYGDASATIEEGMRRHADWPGAGYQLRGDLFKGAEDDLKSFLKLLQETVNREPGNASYRFLLAHQQWFDGQRVEAIENFRLARTTAGNPIFIDAFLKHANQVAAQ